MKTQSGIIIKVANLLSSREKRKLIFLCLIALITAGLEILSILSILPFMTVATNAEVIHTNATLSRLYNLFAFSSEREFLITLGIASLLFLVIGNLLTATTTWLFFKLAYMQSHILAKRVLANYLQRPYEFFLNKNSSDILKSVLTDTTMVVNDVIAPMTRLLSRLFSAFFILAMLITLNPKLALSTLFILGLGYLAIGRYFRAKMLQAGKVRAKSNKERFEAVSRATGGIKDIKLLNCEDIFLQDFERPSHQYAYAQTCNYTISEIPRYFLEMLAFGGILTIVLLLLASETQGTAIATASVYAFAGYKLLPSLQEIFSAVVRIRYGLPILEALHNEFANYKPPHLCPARRNNPTPINFQKAIILEDVCYSYKESKPIIKKLNLTIEFQTCVGIGGPTGCGKSTLVDIIVGLLIPTQGKLLVDGELITETNLAHWQANIAYVPQFIFLLDDTVVSNIAFGVPVDQINLERVRWAAKLANIDQFIEKELTLGYHTVVGERGVRLSGGQRQRIGIARALYRDSKLLVLDEATSALDYNTEERIIESIRAVSRNKTLIMIAHRTTTLKQCELIYHLNKGELTS